MTRDDLQGVRGVAVLLVLIFHLVPDRFRLGFIGVDMFFVLSGFLMSYILAKQELSFSVTTDFYRRRFKRIVPVFLIVSCFIYAGCYFVVLKSEREDVLTDMKWAITFTSNIQPIYEAKGYWDQISSYRFFLHCWSLGVELQFYIVAPLMLGMTNRWTQSKRVVLYSILSCASIALQLLSPPNISYGLMFSRVWQFLFGSLTFEGLIYSDLTEHPRGSRRTADFILIGLLLPIICNPSFISPNIMRLFGTFATALIIYVSSSHTSSILTHRSLVYLGDISYSLYLVHWPVIVGTKYYLNQNPLRTETSCVLFIVTILLAALFHHGVEKNVIHKETRLSVIVVVVCMLSILFTIPYYCEDVFSFRVSQRSDNINITAVIDWNIRESKKVYFKLPCGADQEAIKWTNLTKLKQLRCHKKGKGNAKILVLGNSIAYRALPLLNDILKDRFSELRLFSISTCVPLINDCPYFTEAAKTVVDKVRPDVLLIIWLTKDTQLLRPFVNPENDTTIRIMQNNLNYYSNRSKHVILDMPYYFVENGRIGYEVAKRLQQNIPLDDLKITRQQDMEQQQFHRARVEKLQCKNCVLNRVNEAMFERDVMYLYNRTSLRAYIGDGTHLTPEGLNLIRHKYEEILEPLLKTFE